MQLPFELRRQDSGVFEIFADDLLSVQRGLGYAHAQDRIMQMLLGRILTEGRITEFFMDTEEAFAFDLIIRKLGFSQDVASDLHELTPHAKRSAEAYCEGFNLYLEKHGFPKIAKLLKIEQRPWEVSDVLGLIKMHTYLGLAQLQERVERFIIRAVYDGVSIDKLKKLFPPHLEEIDPDLISHLHLERPYLDSQVRFAPGLSNNWVLAPHKSASGAPLCANDPHLQVNRLPPIWYEVVLRFGDEYQMGITAPGFPGVVMGRSRHLYASFSYGMMDTVDFFIEEIRDGAYRRGDHFVPLKVREEVIHRKKEGSMTLPFYETDAGVLEQSPEEDGYYLSLAWTGYRNGSAPILNALVDLWDKKTVPEAQLAIRGIPLSCNWALADQEGNIGFQQSGRLPKRRHSGLFPLPAWEEENLWKGFVDPSEFTSELNPERGFIASANDDKNHPNGPLSISIFPGSYRYEQICRILSQERTFTHDEMIELQGDLYSIQAEIFMRDLRDLIPETENGKILKEWDCRYTKESKGATLFEAFYFALLEEIFGPMFGRQNWREIALHHSLLVFTYQRFDQVLLSDDPVWFPEGRMACYQRMLEKVLSETETILPWGKKNYFTMQNLLFNGRLPKFLGFDLGPLEMGGSRATINAVQIFHEHRRGIASAASYRMVTDLSKDEAFTALAGGVSEKRFSKYYTSDVERWLSHQYKTLSLCKSFVPSSSSQV